MLVKRDRSRWELPEGFKFTNSRTLIVLHIQKDGELYAICGAETTDKFGPLSNIALWVKLCPKCRKAAPDYGLEIPNLSPIKKKKEEAIE